MTTNLVRTDAERLREITTPNYDELAVGIEQFMTTGDVSAFPPARRGALILAACRTFDLPALQRPFDLIKGEDGKVVLYLNARGAKAIGYRYRVSIRVLRRAVEDDLYIVEVEARTPDGRTTVAEKCVPLKVWSSRTNAWVDPSPRDHANLRAKCETGAIRRGVLGHVGVGDGAEIEDMPHARRVIMDPRGEIVDEPTPEQVAIADDPEMAALIGAPTVESESDADDSPIPVSTAHIPSDERLEPVKRIVPRQSFRPSEDDVRRHCGAWFAIVKNTRLDDDDARHAYVRDWIAKLGWPERKRTESLRVMFARMTEDESQSFLAHLRALIAHERGDYALPDDDPTEIE